MAVTSVSAGTFAEAWNTRRPEAVARCYAPDGARVQMAYPPERIEGREALAEHVGAIMEAWPDFVLDVRSRAVTADGVVVMEWTFRGVQRADYGLIPGNGQELALEGVSIIEMRDGLIGEERVYWDGVTLMAGAGMLPD
jgi:steroid delta-isomerase-like uncharacterized protein